MESAFIVGMKYRLLDLYCCAGGASYGYQKAGFDVVGVDLYPQPKYRGEFVQSDAISFLLANWKSFDAVHASPPCQAYSKASSQFRDAGKVYPDLVSTTRDALVSTGLPYIIENVPGSPLLSPVVLCGSMFGIETYRHRLFESNITLQVPDHPKHINKNAKMGRMPKDGEFIQYVGNFPGINKVREMTGLYWLGQKEMAQSIPPQYTEYLGKQLIAYLDHKVVDIC